MLYRIHIYNNNDDECGIFPVILVHIIIVIRVWYASLCRYPITVIYNIIWTCGRFIRDEHRPTISAQLPSFISEPLVLLLLYVILSLRKDIDHTNVILNSILCDCVKFSSRVTWTTVNRNKLIAKSLWLL